MGVMKPAGDGPGRRERAKRGGNLWDWIKGEMIDISFFKKYMSLLILDERKGEGEKH